jgi:DNA-binding response OmpR family regulator
MPNTRYSDSVLVVDVSARRVVVGGSELELSDEEFKVLVALVESPDVPVQASDEAVARLSRALAAAGAAKSLERSSDGWYYRPSLGY